MTGTQTLRTSASGLGRYTHAGHARVEDGEEGRVAWAGPQTHGWEWVAGSLLAPGFPRRSVGVRGAAEITGHDMVWRPGAPRGVYRPQQTRAWDPSGACADAPEETRYQPDPVRATQTPEQRLRKRGSGSKDNVQGDQGLRRYGHPLVQMTRHWLTREWHGCDASAQKKVT